MTKREVCEALELGRNTFWIWEGRHPEFREAIFKACQSADERVEASLYERAIGYEYATEKVYHYQGVPVRIPVKEHVPADPQSMIFWLKNRLGDRWKDRQEIQHTHLFNFVGMVPSDEEWIEQYGSHPEPLVIDQRPKDMDTNPDPDDARHGGTPTDIIDKKGNGSSE